MFFNFGTKHTLSTVNPQSYWEHGCFSVCNSFKLIWLGVIGVVHGILPEIKWMQFYTSSGILRSTKKLIESKRHDDEIAVIFSKEFLDFIKVYRGEH